MPNLDDVRADFSRLFGAAPRIFRAPGRVNLIGEHTDYNNGFVMPAAIGFATWAAIAPRGDRTLEIYSTNRAESVTCDLDVPKQAPRGHWSDYVLGVAVMLAKSGHSVKGANLVVGGDVPIGSGLSSSAALEVSTAFALLANSGNTLDPTQIALLCQRAENEFVGTRSGIMDQFVSCWGRAGFAILLDCQSLAHRYVPIPDRVELVICDTMVHHDLAAGQEYNTRGAQCEAGVEALRRFLPDIRSLRDVTEAQLAEFGSALNPLIYRRCRHVIRENARVLAAASALERGDLTDVGRLMVESHRSLRDDYEVSSKELDLMVELALELGRERVGVYGARMTGGGFGGCTVNLVERDEAPEFAREIAARCQRKTGRKCAVWVCAPSQGAAEWTAKE